jgi:hypothetical protein
VSADIQQRIHDFLDGCGLDYEVMACDPELADTVHHPRRRQPREQDKNFATHLRARALVHNHRWPGGDSASRSIGRGKAEE